MKSFGTTLTCMLLAAPLLAATPDAGQAIRDRFRAFLAEQEALVAPLMKDAALAYWEAATTGKDEAYQKQAELQTKLETIFTDARTFAYLKEVRASGAITDPLERRQLEILYLQYLGRQLDPALLARIIAKQSAVEQKFNTFRARVDDTEVTDNQIEEVLKSSTDRAVRRSYYLASKQVGAAVAADVVELAKLRNEAARKLGFRDFYAMQLALAEQDEEWLLRLWDELDRLTAEPFRAAKARIDAVPAARLGIKPEEMAAWDYSNRFFQEAPNLTTHDFDKPLADKDIAREVGRFYAGIGLDAGPILARSDLYERPGKYPHAFCTDIDRAGDVRTLMNIKPNQSWLDTALHELGHGVYSYYVRRDLPFFLRSEAHIFTTEAVAMMFGRLAENAGFFQAMGYIDEATAKAWAPQMDEKLRTQELIFARWTQVMLRFEKGLYANPDQDLDALWWGLVEKYQRVPRPAEAPKGAWAAKIHIASVPVYYHNYQLGALFASQLEAAISARVLGGKPYEPAALVGNPKVGGFMREKVFAPGASLGWQEFVKQATGQELGPKAFAARFVK
ncbi:MAG TPA: M2 family metallopeptidase [Thermoanaerobaculaceae bacterium]|nr:M2 family metallopeptidase [Thermoanaerobaculaceae bacterium]HRS17471.1 M2 family metallopeptidase [Thermoanaerobaculaceae bacterium]